MPNANDPPRTRWSIHDSLFHLAKDPIASALFAVTDSATLRWVASRLVELNSYSCATTIKRSLRRVKGAFDLASVIDSVEHALFCAHRNMEFTERGILRSFNYVGLDNLEVTKGSPTILVAPMCIASVDATAAIANVFSNRQVVLYGESPSPTLRALLSTKDNFRFLDKSTAPTRDILRTLGVGGVFCTLPDFVYAGHQTIEGKLFGTQRQFSKSFVRLCARDGVNLLPVFGRYIDEVSVEVEFDEPVVVQTPGLSSSDDMRIRIVLEILIQILESLILKAPQKWLLLATLVAESERDHFEGPAT